MSIMIAIPCMDTVPVSFMRSLLYLDKTPDTSCVMEDGSLVYDSRNRLFQKALQADVDKVLWFDSDMTFPEDALMKLSQAIDDGYDIVSGLYFKRRPPFAPVIYKECCIKDLDGGFKEPFADPYLDYPQEGLFKIAACGFGCVMMSKNAIKTISERFGIFPFMPVAGFGEDMSFCLRVQQAGIDIWCDPSVKCGHTGYYEFNESYYLQNGGAEHGTA